MARKAPYRAVAKIDPDALASFQAGIRKRYSNDQIVAETTADPSGSRAASRSTASGSSLQRSFPGIVVPPPVPARRERRPATRATATSAASDSGRRTADGGYPRPRPAPMEPRS